MPIIDLHTHSRYSDGTSNPADVVRLAKNAGVQLFVLSDHDTTNGWAEAKAEADAIGLDIRPGIEINTISDAVHLLGYGIDPENEFLQGRLEEFRSRRRRRISAIVDRLNLEAGLKLNFDEIQSLAGHTVGRPHIADALRRQKVVGSRREAFERFLVKGKPGYVDPLGPTVTEAIEAIRGAGGFAVLAHPGLLRDGSLKLEEWVPQGLAGIEAYYLNHKNSTTREFLEYADDWQILATGGSDYHGPGSGREKIGGVEVSEDLFKILQERL